MGDTTHTEIGKFKLTWYIVQRDKKSRQPFQVGGFFYFKAVMRVSPVPGKYLENLRLAMARQLVQTGMGLKHIAARTGYASPSTLSRALTRSV